MSTTCCVYPIVAALVAAEKILGPERAWTSVNAVQREFFRKFFAVLRNQVGSVPEIETIASWKVDEISAFLQERGFEIKLDPFPEGGFGAAAVLDLLVKWVNKGVKESVVTPDRRTFPGVRLKKNDLMYFKSPAHNHPVVLLQIQTPTDGVYITMLDEEMDGFGLVDKAMSIKSTLQRASGFKDLVFPMVDLNHQPDISWLLNAVTNDQTGAAWFVSQALQQTKLRMNEIGARVQSAAAIGMLRGMAPKEEDLIINKPFLIWFERAGLSVPFFAGRITEENWKEPANLD